MVIRKYILLVFGVQMSFFSLLMGQDIDQRFTENEFKIQDRFVKAKLLATLGKKADAIKLMDSVRRESPPDASIYFELAKLYLDQNDYNQTEANISSALKLAPGNVWIRNFEVDYFKKVGRDADAIKALSYLITLKPKQSDYYDRLVQMQIHNKDLDAALITLDNKEKNIGWSVNNSLKRAEILDNAGKVSEAVQVISALAAKFPKDIKYLRIITNMLHSNDKVAETEPFLRKILEIDPNDNDAKLGLILLSKGDIGGDEFLVTLHPLISNPDASIDMKIKELLPFVQKHADTGDTTLAKQLTEICDKLVIAHPKEAKAHAIYGDILKNSGNLVAAIRQYEKTLTLHKNNFAVWEQLMFCLDETDNDAQLSSTAVEAMDYFPNQAISYYFYGKSLSKSSNYAKATSTLDEASMIAAGNPNIESRILTTKAYIAFKLNEVKQANELVDKAIAMSNDKNADAYELKGDMSIAAKNTKNAQSHYQKAIDLGGNATRLMLKLSSSKTK